MAERLANASAFPVGRLSRELQRSAVQGRAVGQRDGPAAQRERVRRPLASPGQRDRPGRDARVQPGQLATLPPAHVRHRLGRRLPLQLQQNVNI